MSRKVYRVPLDFSWPMKKVWQGFIEPENLKSIQCTACDGDGMSAEGKHLRDKWYGYAPFKPEDRGSVPFTKDSPPVRAFAERNVNSAPGYYGVGELMVRREGRRLAALFNGQWSHHLNQDDVDALIERGRLMDLTHDFIPGTGWVDAGRKPTAEQVNNWSIGGFGHDSINQWVVCKAEAKRLGIEATCQICNGEGAVYRDEEHRIASETWQREEPPVGDGWQMWETVSEGSPISPVFSTARGLAVWLATMKANAGGNFTATYDEWIEMINADESIGTMVISDGVMMSGVSAVARI